LTGFDLAVLVVGIGAGAIAAIAGFGVGSLLTPLLTIRFDAKLAVALVALPHAIATFVRLWRLRHDIDWLVLRGFGVASAIGGLTGAYVFTQVPGEVLARVLGALLVFVGCAQLLGVVQRLRFHGAWAWLAGALSGVFGGMVGNQGGIRSAGLLAFDLSPKAFVATAAAIALIVDAVRVPLYVWDEGRRLADELPVMMFATAGVIVGTFAGSHLLLRLPAPVFRRTIGLTLLALGVWMLR
jgi:uncharacterized membrane protein YfcA